MNEFNHKTVFVLDHSPYFGISAENILELVATGPPISKSLWTCSVESSVEYCRIVWDLFPTGKLIRFVVSDSAAHIVNTWTSGTQNLSHIVNAMAMVGVPPRATSQTAEYSVIHGLRAAVEALAEPTDFQKEQMILAKTENCKLVNRGRVICITSARDDASMKSLEDIFHTVLIQQNSIVAQHPDLLKVDQCHLVIINLFPCNMDSLVTNRPVMDISPVLTSEIHSIRAVKISNKLTHLILLHYDLASTTVTGIPMKEEQNASSSANYDVEIFHGRRAHSVFLGTELVLPRSLKEGAEYETVTLKWCTPRSCGSSEMQPCLALHRITPVDVTSRPSSCLINFLLNGRSVLLEMPRKSGGKITSHLLSAHGGEIFIHSLNVSRSSLEDLPSISEGMGGRVTDYRITDFGQLIKMSKLVPLKPLPDPNVRYPDENLLKTRSRLAKKTRYWPLTLGNTVLHNVRSFVEPILTFTQKEELTDEEVLQCKQAIYNIIALENRHDPLPLPNMGNRLKGVKKDEQYRLLWSELDTVIGTSGQSKGHKAVLSCLRECRTRSNHDPIIDTNKMEVEPLVDPSLRVSVIRATTDSPLSPPCDVGTSRKRAFSTGGGTRSLLDIFIAADRAQSQKRLDFSGRLCTPQGQIAKLYPQLGLKDNNSKETEIKLGS
uniref:Protein asunder n=1 Tax=Culicoides sonorensis TaxID=179676 RepID=A0A336MX73_CULSO